MPVYNSSYTGAQHDTYVTKQQLVNLIYPVGSIYISYNSTSPATLFGGTWEAIQGRFLLGTNSTYTAHSTGGEANHTLTANEMPSHAHAILSGYGDGSPGTDTYRYQYWASSNRGWKTGNLGTNSQGGGAAHNNMPPYLAVYMWRRTA